MTDYFSEDRLKEILKELSEECEKLQNVIHLWKFSSITIDETKIWFCAPPEDILLIKSRFE